MLTPIAGTLRVLLAIAVAVVPLQLCPCQHGSGGSADRGVTASFAAQTPEEHACCIREASGEPVSTDTDTCPDDGETSRCPHCLGCDMMVFCGEQPLPATLACHAPPIFLLTPVPAVLSFTGDEPAGTYNFVGRSHDLYHGDTLRALSCLSTT